MTNEQGGTLLHTMTDRHVRLFPAVLAQGVDINFVDIEGNTAIHCYTPARQKIIELLVAANANKEIQNKISLTPLGLAIKRQQPDAVQHLLSLNCSVNDTVTSCTMVNDVGYSPLHLAINSYNLEIVKLLVAGKADLNFQTTKTKDTPILAAATSGNTQIVEFLIEAKSDLNLPNLIGSTPLHSVLSLVTLPVDPEKPSDYKAVAKLLINAKCDLNAKSLEAQLNTTALRILAVNGQLDLVQYLVEAGCDKNPVDSSGDTPLFCAIALGHSVAKYLIHAKCDVNYQNPTTGGTLMECAASVGRIEIMELLLSEGCDKNVQNKEGDTPLHTASYNGYTNIVKLLADSTNINNKNSGGGTPLHVAVEEDKKEVVEVLLAARADLDSQDEDGDTPLHVAVAKEREELVKRLIDAKSNVDIKNNQGKTGLENVPQKSGSGSGSESGDEKEKES